MFPHRGEREQAKNLALFKTFMADIKLKLDSLCSGKQAGVCGGAGQKKWSSPVLFRTLPVRFLLHSAHWPSGLWPGYFRHITSQQPEPTSQGHQCSEQLQFSTGEFCPGPHKATEAFCISLARPGARLG